MKIDTATLQNLQAAAEAVKFNQDNFFERVHKEPSEVQYQEQSFVAQVDKFNSSYNVPQTADSSGADKQGFSLGFFGDVLDVVNPLQHIPVVSNIYRQVSGDDIRGLSRVAGGALYGGPIGAASSAVNAIVEAQTGRDIGGHIFAFDGKGNAVNKPAPNYQEMTAKYTHQMQNNYND